MPRSLSPAVRESARQRLLSGLPASRVAADLGVATRTVERLRARLRLLPPGEPLAGGSGRCGRSLAPARLPVRAACAQLRRLHPGWGAGRIRLDLLQRFGPADVPPARTLQPWLARDCPVPAAPPAHHAADYRRAEEPHQVWQMDAVEGLVLKDGSGASWLRMTDEASGAVLWAELFPPEALGQRAGGRGAAGAAGGVRPVGLSGGAARR